MSATTTTSRTTQTVLNVRDAVDRASSHVTLSGAVSQTLTMAGRALKMMWRKPEQMFDVIIQPLLFTAMFAYIFGGAVSGNVAAYLPVIIPGLIGQTVLTACVATGG